MNEITVVMPAYREKKEQICQAIESILNQTYRDYQYIIILDDPDNNELRELIQEYEKKDTRISLYVNEKNIGCPMSKDKGVRLSKSQYVAIMDADDVAHPTRLEKQLSVIQQGKLDLIGSYVRVIDDYGNLLYEMNNLPTEHEQIVKKLKVNNCIVHPTWFFEKSMYLKLNGYSDMQGCEDYDFLLRAVQKGYRLGIVDEILLDYRLSTYSISRNGLYKQYLMMRYIQDYYFKHTNGESYLEFEKKHYTEKKALRYAKASFYFENAIRKKNQKKYVRMCCNLFKIMICSKDYFVKIVRYVMQEI